MAAPFPSNGQGSDHGWGSHHLILGGAVKGQRTYGQFPALTVNGPNDTSTGRWIPTTAIDQYFATLATWFGVDQAIFPPSSRTSDGSPRPISASYEKDGRFYSSVGCAVIAGLDLFFNAAKNPATRTAEESSSESSSVTPLAQQSAVRQDGSAEDSASALRNLIHNSSPASPANLADRAGIVAPTTTHRRNRKFPARTLSWKMYAAPSINTAKCLAEIPLAPIPKSPAS